MAWHRAGGFAELEVGGWHRATIFRKVRRFRGAFGAHPDEYTPWIRLNLERPGRTRSEGGCGPPAGRD